MIRRLVPGITCIIALFAVTSAYAAVSSTKDIKPADKNTIAMVNKTVRNITIDVPKDWKTPKESQHEHRNGFESLKVYQAKFLS